MAEAFVDTANGISDDAENVFGSSGKGNIKILKIICVGDWSGQWSKGVFYK